MNFLIVVALALAVAAEDSITTNYHEAIGIPEATRIWLAERAQDFDGSKIVGGQASALGANPHLGGLIIVLTNGRQSVCGSSLISNTKLVTAAHCWRDSNSQARQFTVVLGSLRLFSGGVRIETRSVQAHASYNTQNLNNDIAIISISHVTFTNAIRRVALATGSNNYVGVWATAAGFGKTSDSAGISNSQSQKHVTMQVITNAVCTSTFGPSVITASTMCTATNAGSTCNGDSGGPLVIGSGDNRQLIGITSFGSGSGCSRRLPAGFTRVTSFATWINARL
ncbi:collagenase-like [Melitaea cinxia]|uniref:collagenase-like n=1 Tax=Melitaea cinxia TaxID=113334 RepID=UPI001E270111|nr:collagenase-like [Melitaea cinxia]